MGNGESYGKRNQYSDGTDVREGVVFASFYRVSFMKFLVRSNQFPYSAVEYDCGYDYGY